MEKLGLHCTHFNIYLSELDDNDTIDYHKGALVVYNGVSCLVVYSPLIVVRGYTSNSGINRMEYKLTVRLITTDLDCYVERVSKLKKHKYE